MAPINFENDPQSTSGRRIGLFESAKCLESKSAIVTTVRGQQNYENNKSAVINNFGTCHEKPNTKTFILRGFIFFNLVLSTSPIYISRP